MEKPPSACLEVTNSIPMLHVISLIKYYWVLNVTSFPGLKHFSGSGYFINVLFFTS